MKLRLDLLKHLTAGDIREEAETSISPLRTRAAVFGIN
jgi:hypothetical protein